MYLMPLHFANWEDESFVRFVDHAYALDRERLIHWPSNIIVLFDLLRSDLVHEDSQCVHVVLLKNVPRYYQMSKFPLESVCTQHLEQQLRCARDGENLGSCGLELQCGRSQVVPR